MSVIYVDVSQNGLLYEMPFWKLCGFIKVGNIHYFNSTIIDPHVIIVCI